MGRRMEKIRARIQAGPGNGFSLHFAHLAHRMVKRGGTIAVLLPMSSLSSGGGAGETWGIQRTDQGWPSFRRKLIDCYTDIRVIGIAGFEDTDSTFSQDTYIAEAMTHRTPDPDEREARRDRLLHHAETEAVEDHEGSRAPGPGHRGIVRRDAILRGEETGTVRDSGLTEAARPGIEWRGPS